MTDMVSGKIGLFFASLHKDSNQPKRLHILFWNFLTKEWLPSQILHRWSSSLTLQKDNLCNAYDAIKLTVCRSVYHQGDYHYRLYSQHQFYMPGSVLTSHRGTLVGRVPIRLDEWDVYWEVLDGDTTILLFPLTRKSVVTSILYLLANCSLAAVQ